MTHIPKKAFIIYSPIQTNQGISNVDKMTLKGCSGQIALEATLDKESSDTVLQLLGLYDSTNKDLKSVFKSRFNDMSLVLLSNAPTTAAIAVQLGCPHDQIQSIEQVTHLTDFDIVFLDFTDYDENLTWTFINDLVEKVNSDTIQCIISPSTSLVTKSTLPFSPKQSYTRKNGIEVAISHQSLIYMYSHTGSGRVDDTTKYTQNDIQENGGNGIILAWHLLAEVAYKLGHTPKYGA